MLKSKWISRIFRAMVCALIFTVAPVIAFGQRWVVVRPRTRSRIVVYQPQPYVIYQRRPDYSYRTYTYSNPGYYPNYSYRYSQPYFATPYTYAWAHPTY